MVLTGESDSQMAERFVWVPGLTTTTQFVTLVITLWNVSLMI